VQSIDVQSLIQHLYVFFAHLGAFGLVLLGILDSSFLMMPLGNDLLLVGLTSQRHNQLIYYIPMAVLGSTLGVLVLDLVLRGTGEDGLQKHISARRVDIEDVGSRRVCGGGGSSGSAAISLHAGDRGRFRFQLPAVEVALGDRWRAPGEVYHHWIIGRLAGRGWPGKFHRSF
jgi:hypothetical protein